MREMKDSGVAWIGEIPEEWEISLINTLYTVRNTKVSDVDYQPLSVTMKGIVPQLSTAAKTNAHDDRKLVKKGDFAINSRSDRRGSCGISDYDGSVSLINTVLSPRNEMNPIYYSWLFHSSEFADEFYRWGHGIVDDLWTTRWQEMRSISIPVPPLSIQHQIAAYLDQKCTQIDALIANQQKQIEKLKAYKQSLITETVTKGLNPDVPMKDSGVEWIGEIPEDWEIIKYGKICKVKSNLVHPSEYLDYIQVAPDNIEKGSGKLLPCLTVKENGIVSDNHLFFKGQLLYSKIRPILNKVTIAPFDGLCSADIYPIETNQDYRYMMYFMLSNLFLVQVKMFTENRVKMPKINQEELAQITSSIPPIEEQQAIVSYLDQKCTQIDNLISIKQRKIEKLQQYKKSVIYEYVTGKKTIYN